MATGRPHLHMPHALFLYTLLIASVQLLGQAKLKVDAEQGGTLLVGTLPQYNFAVILGIWAPMPLLFH